jgi:hypothetical protein
MAAGGVTGKILEELLFQNRQLFHGVETGLMYLPQVRIIIFGISGELKNLLINCLTTL